MFKTGDFVSYLWLENKFSNGLLFGIVEKSGMKTFTVRWESGIKNRLMQNRNDVKLLIDLDSLEEARKIFI